MFAQCLFRAVAVRAAAGVVLLAGAALPAFADEGMWLLNAPPVRDLKKTWKFEAAARWYEHAQRSAVKFPGGSGALVSSSGLVMTNHHVGLFQALGPENEKARSPKTVRSLGRMYREVEAERRPARPALSATSCSFTDV